MAAREAHLIKIYDLTTAARKKIEPLAASRETASGADFLPLVA